MLFDEQNRPESRPRIICFGMYGSMLEYAKTLEGDHTCERIVGLSKTAEWLWAKALESGLPLAVWVHNADEYDLVGRNTCLNILASDMWHLLCSEVDQSEASCVEFLQSLINELTYDAGDILIVGDIPPPPADPSIDGLRLCSAADAFDMLEHLSHSRRQAAFQSVDSMSDRMANRVLVPLDLDLHTMKSSHDIFEFGREEFDTVLLLETVAPTQGFKVKSLEKLIAGYAPILYGLSESDDPGGQVGFPYAALDDALSVLWAAGARTLLLVSKSGRKSAQAGPFFEKGKEMGFKVEMKSWKKLF